MNQADHIRDHINRVYIEPARKQGARKFTIRSGDVHSEMGLENRMPAVCSVLDGVKFQQLYRVRQIDRKGPPQGSTANWTFEILP